MQEPKQEPKPVFSETWGGGWTFSTSIFPPELGRLKSKASNPNIVRKTYLKKINKNWGAVECKDLGCRRMLQVLEANHLKTCHLLTLMNWIWVLEKLTQAVNEPHFQTIPVAHSASSYPVSLPKWSPPLPFCFSILQLVVFLKIVM